MVGVPARHLLQFDRAEDGESQVQFFCVQDRDVAADEAVPFQALEPLEDGRRGQVDAGGQLLGGQPRVGLEAAEDRQVGGVEFRFGFHGKNIILSFGHFLGKSFYIFHNLWQI